MSALMMKGVGSHASLAMSVSGGAPSLGSCSTLARRRSSATPPAGAALVGATVPLAGGCAALTATVALPVTLALPLPLVLKVAGGGGGGLALAATDSDALLPAPPALGLALAAAAAPDAEADADTAAASVADADAARDTVPAGDPADDADAGTVGGLVPVPLALAPALPVPVELPVALCDALPVGVGDGLGRLLGVGRGDGTLPAQLTAAALRRATGSGGGVPLAVAVSLMLAVVEPDSEADMVLEPDRLGDPDDDAPADLEDVGDTGVPVGVGVVVGGGEPEREGVGGGLRLRLPVDVMEPVVVCELERVGVAVGVRVRVPVPLGAGVPGPVHDRVASGELVMLAVPPLLRVAAADSDVEGVPVRLSVAAGVRVRLSVAAVESDELADSLRDALTGAPLALRERESVAAADRVEELVTVLEPDRVDVGVCDALGVGATLSTMTAVPVPVHAATLAMRPTLPTASAL
jgi:hypothetical protein